VQATYQTALLMANGRRLESSRTEAQIRAEIEQAAGLGFAWPPHLREVLAAGVN